MEEMLKKERENYLKQLTETEQAIGRTENSLKGLKQTLEQLKGAIFAVDAIATALQKQPESQLEPKE